MLTKGQGEKGLWILAIRDTAFIYMMTRDKKYTAQAYKALTGNEVDADKIEYYSLKDRFEGAPRYNDLAFVVDGWHMMILIEHQSTINPNMCFRMLEYFVYLLDQYIRKNKLNKFGVKEMRLPKAEFYIVYNGDEPLKENFLKLNLGSITASAEVLDIHFENLKDKSKDNALAGYARFIDFSKSMGVIDAIKATREEGYLPQFFQEGTWGPRIFARKCIHH